MYSLFWKIFLTYWLAILSIELFTVWSTAELSEYKIHPIVEQRNAQFVSNSNQAVSILSTHGLGGFRDWLSNANNLENIDEIFVINQNREEINNKPLPDSINTILQGDYTSQANPYRHQPINKMLITQATTPDGGEYLLISTFKHPQVISYLLAPQRVMFGVVVSGLICFFLARYFTSPLAKLRGSTQRLMRGEFDTTSLQHLRKRTDEFGALAVDFETMSERLHNLLDAKKQLLRDISHELRSPLARIRVALGLARNKYKETDCDELDRIERDIERFELMINELLTFVRIGPSNPAISMGSVNLFDVLGYVVEDAKYEQQQTRNANIISLHCPADIEINADAHLLHRVFENIVRNACYYSPKGAAIDISCIVDANKIVIEIRDEGPGVPEEMLEKIFQPFVRVSSAREADTGGSGIGLAIAKRVIDLHKGRITAENKPDHGGLIVKVVLPLEKESVDNFTRN